LLDRSNKEAKQESDLFCGCNKNALHFYFCIPQDSRAGNTEAKIVVPVVRVVVVTVG